MRRAAWTNLDKFGTTWVTAWPSVDCRLSNAEFGEVVARYFGLPSPACALLVGQPIGNSRSTLDRYGARLTAATLPGDGFRRQHNALKWRLSEDCRETGVRARTEVFGLFAAVLPQHTRTESVSWPLRKRQGMVPDFAIALPTHGQHPDTATDELFELKTLHYGTTMYPSRLADTRGGAVERRAQMLPREYAGRARRLDEQFCGTLQGETGPVARRLDAYGAVRGLVFGHFAEASTHVEELLSGCAHSGAMRHWSVMRAREPADAVGSIAWMLRRRWGMTAWRSAARLLLERIEYVGRGAMQATSRRAAAVERAAHERRTLHWLYRRQR